MSELVIQKDWILITYDIPKSQDSIRKKTIRTLRKMGALRHTDSVYYLPFNAQAYELAANLPGKALFGGVFRPQTVKPTNSQETFTTK